MLNLALVALLSGSLLTGSTDDDCKKDNTCEQEQTQIIVDPADDERSIISDAYAFGRTSAASPVKLWLEYAMGGVDELYTPNGTAIPAESGGAAVELNGTRLAGGLQLNLVNTSSFSFGVGAEVSVAKDELNTAGGATTLAQSAFGLQNVKIFGAVRGRVVGIHGGYILDMADDPTEENQYVTTDMRDAIFVGADFDYPSERYRLFGGADFFMLQDPDSQQLARGGGVVTTDDTKVLVATMGAGLRFSVFELGAALIIRAQLDTGEIVGDTGSHHGSIAPYLRISPSSIPVSLFVKGAVNREYVDYGYAIGGGNDIQSGVGFTAGLTVGFN